VPLEVLAHQHADQGVVLGRERPAVEQDVAEGAGAVGRPVVEGGDQVGRVDEPVLQGQHGEQEVAVDVEVGHGGGPVYAARRRAAMVGSAHEGPG
jgi:hypothetical protein